MSILTKIKFAFYFQPRACRHPKSHGSSCWAGKKRAGSRLLRVDESQLHAKINTKVIAATSPKPTFDHCAPIAAVQTILTDWLALNSISILFSWSNRPLDWFNYNYGYFYWLGIDCALKDQTHRCYSWVASTLFVIFPALNRKQKLFRANLAAPLVSQKLEIRPKCS